MAVWLVDVMAGAGHLSEVWLPSLAQPLHSSFSVVLEISIEMNVWPPALPQDPVCTGPPAGTGVHLESESFEIHSS